MSSELHNLLSAPCYHGSLNSEITKFREGSHFGSRIAALGAASAKFYDAGGAPATGALYGVTLNINPDECLVTGDWGRSTHLGLLAHLATKVPDLEYLRLKVDEAKVKLGDTARYGWEGAKRESEAFSLNVILEVVEATGIKAVAYTNIVEGERNSLSISVLDPTTIEVTSRESLSSEVLADGAKYLSEQRQLTFQNRNAQ
ncbi:UNVERIFIED_ORG: hypothetical protein BDU10_2547 [Burkholderia sp. CF145]